MDGLLILTLLSFAGAAISLLLRARPQAVKTLALLVTGTILIGLALGTGGSRDPITSMSMMLIAVTAFISILGQQRTPQASPASMMILVLHGLTLGSFAGGRPMADLFLVSLMSIISLALLRNVRTADSLLWGAAVCLGAGSLCLVASLAASDATAVILHVIAFATLLPLFPLQAAFVGTLSYLSGSVPAFLAVALPLLGWNGVASVIHEVPGIVKEGMVALAIAGALFGTMRAAVQIHLKRMLASITTVLLAGVWWHLGTVGTAAPAGGWYVGAVVTAASGLLLAAHLLEARYGVLDVEKLGGLARPMPRFTVVVGLLFMAAMGLPLFGVFSAFMTMMFAASSPASLSVAIVLLIWFLSSVLLLKLLHRLFYGQPRGDLLYQDLTLTELLPFALMIGLLVLGQFPGNLFPVGDRTTSTVAAAGAAP
jgi:NADH-quinone oxidoreductase subunit M